MVWDHASPGLRLLVLQEECSSDAPAGFLGVQYPSGRRVWALCARSVRRVGLALLGWPPATGGRRRPVEVVRSRSSMPS